MRQKEPGQKLSQEPDTISSGNHFLILHNDEIHTFDFVIEALVEICGHEYTQASQCAYITHYRGRCDIKKGTFEELKDMKDALNIRELTVTLE